MHKILTALTLVFGMALVASPVFAMGSDNPPTPTAKQQMEDGKKAIYAGKYDDGIALMKKVINYF